MNLFAQLVAKYLITHPAIVERLAVVLLDQLVAHIAPQQALSGDASASPVAGLTQTIFPSVQVTQR